MSLAPTLRELSSTVADAWWMATDAFTAADLLPLFAIRGLARVAAEERTPADAPAAESLPVAH